MHIADYWIKKLKLQHHPEGGWFKEVYRADVEIKKSALPDEFDGDRNISTSIYYLLQGNDFSCWHRIKSDEIWHFYTGNSALEICSIENERIVRRILGANAESGESFQLVIPENCWFGARLLNNKGFCLVGCSVSPGFDFHDFELGDAELVKKYPEYKAEILSLLRQ